VEFENVLDLDSNLGFKFKFAKKKIWKAFLFSLSGPKSISTRALLAARSSSLYFFCFYFHAGPVSSRLLARYRPNPLIIFFLRSSSRHYRPRLELPRRALLTAGSSPAPPPLHWNGVADWSSPLLFCFSPLSTLITNAPQAFKVDNRWRPPVRLSHRLVGDIWVNPWAEQAGPRELGVKHRDQRLA
jgi:hypothetical protein